MSELQGLQSGLEEIRDAGADVVVVSVDAVDDNRRVVDRLGLGFPILSDADLRVISAYGVVHHGGGIGGGDIARPAVFVIAADGTVLWRSLTDNWRVRVSARQILNVLR